MRSIADRGKLTGFAAPSAVANFALASNGFSSMVSIPCLEELRATLVVIA
jgi:hypothetical protein